MRIAPAVELDSETRDWLMVRARARSAPARLVERCRIVLLAAEGKQNKEVADTLGIGAQKAARWRGRFLRLGTAGLEKDAPRPGRTPRIKAAKVREILRRTQQEEPPNATHWSTRTMVRTVGVSPASVRRVWASHGLKPHRLSTFKLSRDPEFAEKLQDIVGLYLNPPEHALVLSCDEKSRIQALDRTQPGLPLRPGHQEWIKFLRFVDLATPANKKLHLVVDNYATHKHPKVRRWLARHPRFHIHFTPTVSVRPWPSGQVSTYFEVDTCRTRFRYAGLTWAMLQGRRSATRLTGWSAMRSRT